MTIPFLKYHTSDNHSDALSSIVRGIAYRDCRFFPRVHISPSITPIFLTISHNITGQKCIPNTQHMLLVEQQPKEAPEAEAHQIPEVKAQNRPPHTLSPSSQPLSTPSSTSGTSEFPMPTEHDRPCSAGAGLRFEGSCRTAWRYQERRRIKYANWARWYFPPVPITVIKSIASMQEHADLRAAHRM